MLERGAIEHTTEENGKKYQLYLISPGTRPGHRYEMLIEQDVKEDTQTCTCHSGIQDIKEIESLDIDENVKAVMKDGLSIMIPAQDDLRQNLAAENDSKDKEFRLFIVPWSWSYQGHFQVFERKKNGDKGWHFIANTDLESLYKLRTIPKTTRQALVRQAKKVA